MALEGNATVTTNFGMSLEICYYQRPNFGFSPFKQIASPNCFLICKNRNITRRATALHISTVGGANSSCILIYRRNYIKASFLQRLEGLYWSEYFTKYQILQTKILTFNLPIWSTGCWPKINEISMKRSESVYLTPREQYQTEGKKKEQTVGRKMLDAHINNYTERT